MSEFDPSKYINHFSFQVLENLEELLLKIEKSDTSNEVSNLLALLKEKYQLLSLINEAKDKRIKDPIIEIKKFEWWQFDKYDVNRLNKLIEHVNTLEECIINYVPKTDRLPVIDATNPDIIQNLIDNNEDKIQSFLKDENVDFFEQITTYCPFLTILPKDGNNSYDRLKDSFEKGLSPPQKFMICMGSSLANALTVNYIYQYEGVIDDNIYSEINIRAMGDLIITLNRFKNIAKPLESLFISYDNIED